MNNFRGELTDNSAKKEALAVFSSWKTLATILFHFTGSIDITGNPIEGFCITILEECTKWVAISFGLLSAHRTADEVFHSFFLMLRCPKLRQALR